MTQSTHQMNSALQNKGIDLEIDLRNFLLMLWRRKFLIVFVMLVFVGIVFFFVNSVQPRYTAKSLIMIENRLDPGPELRSLISNMRVDTTFIIGEAEVIKSRVMAKRVIDKLDLMNDPEFNPKLRLSQEKKTVSLSKLKDDLHSSGVLPQSDRTFKTLSVYNRNKGDLPAGVVNPDEGLVVDRFLKNISAKPIPGSFVMQIEYISENASKAALIANTIVDTYIEQRLEQKFQASQKLSDWLDGRLNGLRKQLRQSEEEIEGFRQENNIISGVRTEVSLQQMSELNSQLVLAKAKRVEAEARLEQISGWIENPSTIETTDEAQSSRILQNLKIKETDIRKTLSEISTRYGDKHPSIIDTKKELGELKSQISNELLSVARGLEAKLKVADARVRALERSIADVETIRQTENEAGITMRELMRESESNQIIFDTFLKTYKRAADRDDLQEAEARVLSYATIPRFPSYPNKPLFLSLATAASFFLGIALSLLMEKLDNAFKTASQIEQETGYPCFGVVPFVKRIPKKMPIADFIFDKKARLVAESIRTIRMVLNLQSKDPEKRPKVITITSSLPDEGKTTLSAWMARLAAKSGDKVVVIDCDLRRPRLHEAFGKKPKNTIVEYLTGRATLEEVLEKDDSGAHIIYARSVPNNALDLLSKDRMTNLIKALRERYDLVILDTPANMAVSDARLLAAQSDRTLYAVSWDDTPREVVNAGVKNFADFGYDALSFVLTNVDVRRHARYGYGDPISYYNRYRKYYSDQ